MQDRWHKQRKGLDIVVFGTVVAMTTMFLGYVWPYHDTFFDALTRAAATGGGALGGGVAVALWRRRRNRTEVVSKEQ